MMRGDLVTIASQGEFGKPRPALVIQANQFSEHTSVTVLLITSTLVAAYNSRARCRKWLTEAFANNGGQSHDGTTR